MKTSYQRFSPKQRIEHVAIMSLFVLLALTGFPQKFFESGWAQSLVHLLGGVGLVRWIHRLAGILFSLLVVVHLTSALVAVIRRQASFATIVPTRRDFTDAIQTLRYYLGSTREHPRFDRFDYRQKFEYWGLVIGSIVMIVTGFVLIYPAAVASVLPGQLIPASKVAHSAEGLMAFLVVLIWHLYNAHLTPDVFPIDTSIFTGRISRERMLHEHPLELERLEKAAKPDEEPGG